MWTPENIETMTALWNDGASASEIALKLGEGCTRNAVIGKITRLRAAKSATIEIKRPERLAVRRDAVAQVRNFMPETPPAPKPSLPAIRTGPPAKAKPEPRRPAVYVPGVPATIIDVTGCRFALREAPVVGGHLFCNAAVDLGQTYCTHHAGVVFNTTQPRQKFVPRTPAHQRALKLALLERIKG